MERVRRPFGSLACLAVVLLAGQVRAQALQAGESLNVLASQIQEEVRIASIEWKLPAGTAITAGDEIKVDADGVIQIGAAGLGPLLPSAVNERRAALTFIVAHEVWHRWQMLNYGKNLKTLNGAERKLLECQADSMAVHRVIKLFDREHAVTNAGLLLRLAHGLAHHAAPWHLSQQERIEAVRAAALRGMLDAKVLSTSVANVNLLAYADLRSGEDLPQWTLRNCKKTLGYGGAALAAITVVDDNIEVHGSPGNERVKYRIIYNNEGERPVRIEGTIGGAPLDQLFHGDSVPKYSHFTLTVPAGRTAAISGEISWPGVTEDVFRDRLYPGYSGDLVPLLHGYFVEPPACMAPQAHAKAYPIVRAIWQIAQDGQNHFKNVAQEEEKHARRARDNPVIGNHIPGMNGGMTIDEAEHEEASVTVEVFNGASESDAQTIFTSYQAMLGKWCAAAGAVPWTGKEHVSFGTSFSPRMTVDLFKTELERMQNGKQVAWHKVWLSFGEKEEDRFPTAYCINAAPRPGADLESRLANAVRLLAAGAGNGFSHLKQRSAAEVYKDYVGYPVDIRFPESLRATWSPKSERGPTATGMFDGLTKQQAHEQLNSIRSGLKNACRTDPESIILDTLDGDLPGLRIFGFAAKTNMMLEVIRDENGSEDGYDYSIRLTLASESAPRRNSK